MAPRFARYAWFVLIVNILVILWGAVVRAVGAGAGCGEHWPLCNGSVLPSSGTKTLIEFGHRITSGMALLLVIGLVIYAFRTFPKAHIVRRLAAWSLVFELTEGLLGAGLVLLGHVAANQSVARGYSLGLHLTNTLLLVGALALTARYATRPHLTWHAASPKMRTCLAIAALGIFVIGVTGAITALGDTLFRTATLAEGMRQDFDPASHPFVKLRIFHPAFAALLGVYIYILSGSVMSTKAARPTVKKLAQALVLITTGQLMLGGLNLVLMAPVPVQLTHLLLADLLWITFVLLSAELLETHAAADESGAPHSHASPKTVLAGN